MGTGRWEQRGDDQEVDPEAVTVWGLEKLTVITTEIKPVLSRRPLCFLVRMGSSKQKRVWKYVEEGSLLKLKSYLRKHRDLNVNFSLDRSGRSPLHQACYTGDDAILRLLLKHGADVLLKDRKGDTALHIAVNRVLKHGKTGKEARAMRCWWITSVKCNLFVVSWCLFLFFFKRTMTWLCLSRRAVQKPWMLLTVLESHRQTFWTGWNEQR